MAAAHLVDSESTFASFSHLLDTRLLRALADMGFARPTLVQSKTIPLALEGRDILARARTGSGKTAAYCVPIVQKILSAKAVCALFPSLDPIFLLCVLLLRGVFFSFFKVI
jgi:ATP-dependent RNA helicase DDX56/DBP9